MKNSESGPMAPSEKTGISRQKGHIGADPQSSGGMALLLAGMMLAAYVNSQNNDRMEAHRNRCERAQVKAMQAQRPLPSACMKIVMPSTGPK
ncbi:MAG: hypothetical protein IPI58_07975 [Alphaproteobacteria bacterium]|nr:MAG: hypothetical protein IPI58_07975 [Alphaproteobacteria bacterium]